MDCQTAQHGISAYLDSAVSPVEQREIVEHLGACRNARANRSDTGNCARRCGRYPSGRRRPISRCGCEWQRQRRACEPGCRQLARACRFSLSNLMRPLALPAVGVSCLAVFLFSTLVPTFRTAFAMDNSPGDVPTHATTQPTLKFMAPVAFFSGDAVVDLKIDEQGRIVNYSIVAARR